MTWHDPHTDSTQACYSYSFSARTGIGNGTAVGLDRFDQAASKRVT